MKKRKPRESRNGRTTAPNSKKICTITICTIVLPQPTRFLLSFKVSDYHRYISLSVADPNWCSGLWILGTTPQEQSPAILPNSAFCTPLSLYITLPFFPQNLKSTCHCSPSPHTKIAFRMMFFQTTELRQVSAVLPHTLITSLSCVPSNDSRWAICVCEGT